MTIVEPENAQINYDTNSVVPYYNEVIQLPGDGDSHMTDVRTKNLVLKRKHPKDKSISVKKYIAGTDINSRSVWNVGETITSNDVIEIEDTDSETEEIPDVKPHINQSGLAPVDIHAMRKMPWVDFSIVLTENDAERRE